jgi:hypothetical protein
LNGRNDKISSQRHILHDALTLAEPNSNRGKAISPAPARRVCVIVLREFGDGELAVEVEHRGLRARAAQGRSGSKKQPEIIVIVAVSLDPHGGIQQFAKANERRDIGPIAARQKRAIRHFL